MSVNVNAPERWRSFVDIQVWEKGHLDQSSYSTFLRAGSLGIDPGEAVATVAARIKAAGDHPRGCKLSQQQRRAYNWTGSDQQASGSHQVPRPPRATFLPDYARRFAGRIPADIDAKWLRKHSPVRVPFLLTPAEFLSAAFEMGDQVLIFSDYRSQGQMLWQRFAFKVDRDELDQFVRGTAEGIWFLANPVDGQYHWNEDQQKQSRRSKESITAFRYAVLESDCQPLEQWLRILVQLPFPIVSIAASGGKSLHALVRVEATSKVDWDRTIAAIKPRLINLGADAGALTAVRLTRLPNCYRGARLQELLYLDPTPSGEPIWNGGTQ